MSAPELVVILAATDTDPQATDAPLPAGNNAAENLKKIISRSPLYLSKCRVFFIEQTVEYVRHFGVKVAVVAKNFLDTCLRRMV